MADLSEELAEIRDAGNGGSQTTIELIAIVLPVVFFRHESAEHFELPEKEEEGGREGGVRSW